MDASPPPSSEETSAKPPRWRPGTFRALRHPNYRLYFAGQIVSLTGSWLQTAAMMWLAFELTQAALWPALISTAHVVPTLLLGLWGGALADRLPRRPLIFAAQSAMLVLSLLLAGLVFADAITPTILLVLSLLLGIAGAIDTPARLAFVIDMVGREDLVNAVALNSLVFNVARMLGPALYGLLQEPLGEGGCILVNSLSFAAVLGALLLMRLPPRTEESHPDSTNGESGFAYLLRRRGLMLLTMLAGAMAFFGWPMLSLLPAISARMLNAGDWGYSWIFAAVGGGALSGALIVATFGHRSRKVLLPLGACVEVVALLGLAQTASVPAAVAWCALSGCGLILGGSELGVV